MFCQKMHRSATTTVKVMQNFHVYSQAVTRHPQCVEQAVTNIAITFKWKALNKNVSVWGILAAH